mmetsp:Transcript_40416/g.100310  ORF Transcript_40416/g.100310 Transcript_40416/m.100310 type:complete len:97 (-) Transcript_40416:156-446(-)
MRAYVPHESIAPWSISLLFSNCFWSRLFIQGIDKDNSSMLCYACAHHTNHRYSHAITRQITQSPCVLPTMKFGIRVHGKEELICFPNHIKLQHNQC